MVNKVPLIIGRTKTLLNPEKKIYIVNGYATSGKDTFIDAVGSKIPILKFSIIDPIKELEKIIVDNRVDTSGKSEIYRNFLSELKVLTDNYIDYSFNEVEKIVDDFINCFDYSETTALFIIMRENKDILRAIKRFGAKTIWIDRDISTPLYKNMADANIGQFQNYDYIIKNLGSINDLDNCAEMFITAEDLD
jgi:hypothetical protein